MFVYYIVLENPKRDELSYRAVSRRDSPVKMNNPTELNWLSVNYLVKSSYVRYILVEINQRFSVSSQKGNFDATLMRTRKLPSKPISIKQFPITHTHTRAPIQTYSFTTNSI